ncbi:MAG: lamin tail domain-containing protein [Candidatus Nanoarchaeia archaeon]|nr:lamin tail domain-containing protein [Candidatus Nanoarchaeia archaeon]
MKKYLVFGLSLILFSLNVNALQLTEIMYNPIQTGSDHEWIEIYNDKNESINISNLKLYEGNTNHKLELKNGNDNLNYNEYAIIANKYDIFLQDFPSFNGNLFDSSFSLSDTNEFIALKYDNGTIIDSVNYTNEIGGDGNGKTIIYYNNYWYESININGTPGSENIISVSSEQDYRNLKINEIFPNPYGNDEEGEFVELYNKGSYDLNLERLKLKDEANHEIIITNINTKNLIIESNGYSAIYMNGFSGFLNNQGFEKVKLYYEDKLIDEISYFNSKEDLSWSKEDDIWALRKPTPNEKNQIIEPESDSKLEIAKIYTGSDNKAKFGDNLLVSVKIYKGNTSRYANYLYLENTNGEQISKRTTVHTNRKYTDYEFTLPIQIDPNCNQKYKDGRYNIALEGLNEKITKEIDISGLTTDLCETVYKEKKIEKEITTLLKTNKIESNLNSSTSVITSNVIYESSDIKAQRSGLYIFSLILIVLMLHWSLKKWK